GPETHSRSWWATARRRTTPGANADPCRGAEGRGSPAPLWAGGLHPHSGVRLRASRSHWPGGSQQDLPQRLGAGFDQANGTADARHILPCRVEAEGQANGGEQVRRGDGPLDDGAAVGTGAADDLAAANTAAAQHHAPCRRVMVAPLTRIDD